MLATIHNPLNPHNGLDVCVQSKNRSIFVLTTYEFTHQISQQKFLA